MVSSGTVRFFSVNGTGRLRRISIINSIQRIFDLKHALTLWIQGSQLDVGGNLPMLQTKDGLDKTGDSC